MDIFTAKIPGADCATASKSTKSLLLSHFRLMTISFSMIGTIAYPPPMVNAPILKNILNS